MHRVRMDDEYDIDARMQLSLEEPLTYCQTSSMPGVDMASAFEWLLVLGILFVTWTFSSSFRRPVHPAIQTLPHEATEPSDVTPDSPPTKVGRCTCIATSLCSLGNHSKLEFGRALALSR